MFDASSNCKESQASTSSSMESSQPCRHFEFSEILLATDNFDESLVIGSGGFGKVYKGNIMNGSSHVVAAIKRLDTLSSQGASEFWAEVETLSKLRHCHLVSLLGYCNYEKEMILIYEYMPNGTLADHLHKLGTPLSWLQRLKMCIGAARGLDYLHTGTGIDVGVTHRDVKSSNILLDKSWAARISDFGLSKIGPTNQPSTYVNTLVKGTFGYLDPDYSFTGRLTRKSDVYALGVVLLEVLCRKLALDRSLDEEQQNLARWAQESIKKGNIKQIVDPGIRGEISPKCLKKFVQLVETCLKSNPKQRPTMAGVVVTLESVLILQEKIDKSLQDADKTILGRMLDMFLFRSNKDNVPVPMQMETNNNVVEDVESNDSASPQEDDNNDFKPRSPVSDVADTTAATAKPVEGEFMEQYEPGVYIYLVSLPEGTRDLKSVRFSRKRFSANQADTWWSENRKQVYKRYNVQIITSPVSSENASTSVSGEFMATSVGVPMETNNHVAESVESNDSLSPQEEENNSFKPRFPVSEISDTTTANTNQVMGEWVDQPKEIFGASSRKMVVGKP